MTSKEDRKRKRASANRIKDSAETAEKSRIENQMWHSRNELEPMWRKLCLLQKIKIKENGFTGHRSKGGE